MKVEPAAGLLALAEKMIRNMGVFRCLAIDLRFMRQKDILIYQLFTIFLKNLEIFRNTLTIFCIPISDDEAKQE